jgi:tetratricopeptide (TPR) repeat protein
LSYGIYGVNEAHKAKLWSVKERGCVVNGHALLGLGRYAEAVVWYKRANTQGLQGQLVALGKMGAVQEALRVAKQEYRLRPNWEVALLGLAYALSLHSSGTKKAREVMVRCLKQGGPKLSAIRLLASLEDESGAALLLQHCTSLETAEAQLPADVRELIPPGCLATEAKAHLLLGQVLGTSQPEAALQAFRKATALGYDCTAEMAKTHKVLEKQLIRNAMDTSMNNALDEEDEDLNTSVTMGSNTPTNPFLSF